MTESNSQPRRSARSTKGQHRSRSDDVTLPVISKKEKTKSENDNDNDNNNEEVVRCICGEQGDDDGRLFVQCDKCHVWQHPDCMLGITKEKDIPDEYFCEECRPDLYPNLVKKQDASNKQDDEPKLKSSPTPQKEEIPKDDEKQSEKEDSVMDKDEPSKEASSPSPLSPKTAAEVENPQAEANNGDESDGDYKEQANPVGEKRKSVSSDGTSDSDQRRSKSARRSLGSTGGEENNNNNNNNKRRRQSSAANAELVESIDDLKDNVRKSVAKALVGIFTKHSPGEEKAAIELSLEIENALYNGFASKGAKEVGQKYRDKFRSLSFNLKDSKNPIGKRVIDKQISPQQLVHMSSDEMRNPELQKLAEHVRAESISQSVLKQDEMPRIRRTHKGEELVETDDVLPASEMSGPAIQPQDAANVIIASDVQNEPEPIIYDPSLSPEGPVTPGNESASDVEEGKKTSTTAAVPSIAMTDDDSHQGPDDAHLVVPPSPPEQEQSSMFDEKNGVNGMMKNADDYDDDIDRLINDNNNNNNNINDTRKEIWSGEIEMPGIAEFKARGAQLSGPRISDETLWSEILPSQLIVDGRLPKETGDGYLNNVAAASKELVGVIFSPMDNENQEAYNKLYEYFLTRSRYGVIKNRPGGPIKDGYIIPIPELKNTPNYLNISHPEKDHDKLNGGVNGWLIYVGVMARPVASFYYSKKRQDCNIPTESMDTIKRLNLPENDLKTLVDILNQEYKPLLTNNIVLSNPAALCVLVEEYRNKRGL